MAALTTPAARVLALLAVTPGADTELAHAWEIPAEELPGYLASVPALTVDQVVDASDVLDAPAAFLARQERGGCVEHVGGVHDLVDGQGRYRRQVARLLLRGDLPRLGQLVVGAGRDRQQAEDPGGGGRQRCHVSGSSHGRAGRWSWGADVRHQDARASPGSTSPRLTARAS